MATGTAGSTARKSHLQMIHFLRKTIVFGDNGTTVTVGTVPAGSLILVPISGVQVDVAFDGNSSNVLSIGASTDSGTNDMASAISLATIGFVTLDETTTAKTVSVDTKIVAAVTSTADAAAGRGEIVIAYIPDIDG